MEGQNIQVNVPEGTKEIVIREGSAEILHEPVKVNIDGLITAPASFFIARETKIELLKSHVIVDRTNLKLSLVVDEDNHFGSNISGTLKYNKELADFGINKNKIYSLKGLTNILRIKRMYFDDREENTKTLDRLYNFEAKVTASIKDADNRKGNIDKQLKKDASSNVPAGFKLNIPIFEGQPASKMFIDVLADISDAQTKFWLESVDLIELEHDLANQIIDEQLKTFRDKIVILEV